MMRRGPDTSYILADSLRRRVDDMKSLVADTEAEAAAVDREMDELKKEIGDVRTEMERIWKVVEGEKEEMGYELAAVFIHRGASALAFPSSPLPLVPRESSPHGVEWSGTRADAPRRSQGPP